MSFVYLIQSNSDGKTYVGVTAGSVESRWRKHLVAARRHNTKLYAAINKHGCDNFTVQAVAEFDSIRDAYRHESLLIRILDSRENGYNIAHGGEEGMRKEIVVAGVVYESHGAAADAHGVPYAAFMDRLYKGRSPEQAAGLERHEPFGGSVVVEGVEYRTLNAAAVAYGVDRVNVGKRVRNLGWSIEEALGIVDRPGTRGKYRRK